MSVNLPADKKIMRIALIGIRPADQVMLKGYFRVLLRLDTDLEWVSANSPVVDLFMISQDFQNAESVQRILGQQGRTNVLYITRSPVDMGSMVGNVLTLPLKELEQLNQWLIQNVAILNSNFTTRPAPSNIPNTSASSVSPINSGRQTLDEIMAQRAANATPSARSNSPLASSSSTITTSPLASLVKVAEQLQKRQVGLQALMQANTILAYIAPDRQRIWVVNNNVDLAQGWTLVATPTQPPILQEAGEDAIHWLWHQTFNASPTLLAQLVRHDILYQITSWLKPAHTPAQHDILKIQCILEAKAATLDTVIETAEVPRELAVRTVAGLIMAGVMPTSVYVSLSTHLTTQATPPPAQPAPQANSRILDSLPTSTATDRPIPAPAPQPTLPTPSPAVKSNDNMKGFLGRLRSKLGL